MRRDRRGQPQVRERRVLDNAHGRALARPAARLLIAVAALAATRKTCERLFSYRKTQPWPPTIVKQDGWDELCEEPAENLSAIEGADDAVRWANELIAGTGSAR